MGESEGNAKKSMEAGSLVQLHANPAAALGLALMVVLALGGAGALAGCSSEQTGGRQPAESEQPATSEPDGASAENAASDGGASVSNEGAASGAGASEPNGSAASGTQNGSAQGGQVSSGTASPGAAESSSAEEGAQVLSEQNKDLTLADIPAEALVSVEELQAMRESDDRPFILDVRSQGQFTSGHIPEARNIPAGRNMDIRMDEVPLDGRTVVIVPQLEERAAEVWQTLVDNGYDGGSIKVLQGGMTAWGDAGMDIQVEEDLGC